MDNGEAQTREWVGMGKTMHACKWHTARGGAS